MHDMAERILSLGQGLDDRRIELRFLAEVGIPFFTTVPRPAMGPTQPRICPISNGRDHSVEQTNLHMKQRCRMRGL
jgi:hypothetical protein